MNVRQKALLRSTREIAKKPVPVKVSPVITSGTLLIQEVSAQNNSTVCRGVVLSPDGQSTGITTSAIGPVGVSVGDKVPYRVEGGIVRIVAGAGGGGSVVSETTIVNVPAWRFIVVE